MLGASDIDEQLKVHLVDGIIYSFQEDQVMLDGFGPVVNALGIRVKPYLTQSSQLFSGGSTTRAQRFGNRLQISQPGWLS